MKQLYNSIFLIALPMLALSVHDSYAQTGTVIVNNVAANGQITGKVTTQDGSSVAWANIGLKQTGKITVTAEDGTYKLNNVKPGIYIIRCSITGLKTQEKTVKVVEDGKVNIDFVLDESASQLSEVLIALHKGLNSNAVTIGKMPASIKDLPQSISIVDNVIIEQQQAMRLSDVVKNINGIYLSTTRGSSQESFSARGYAFSSTNMFKNGSRINTGAMPEMSSLERVEVLKGSAAILYGNVSAGGILNMVTKKPKFTEGGEFSMRYGSYNLYKPAVDVYGPINQHIAYRLNTTFEHANSYRNSVSTERFYVNPSFLFNLGSKTELIVEGDYLNHNFTPDFGTGAVNNAIVNNGRSTFLGALWSNATTQQATSSATLNHLLSNNWKLNFVGSYQFYKRDYFSTERIQPLANGDWTRPLGRTKTSENYFTAQLNFSGKLKTGSINHVILTGIDADKYQNLNYTFNGLGNYDKINILDLTKYTPRTDIPVVTEATTVTTPTNRYGAYVQDLISVLPKVKVLAGLRYSIQQAFAAKTFDLTKKIDVIPATTVSTRTDKAFSPRFGLVYQPSNRLSLFASYANSFAVNAGSLVSGEAVPPSIIDQYELGVKQDFFNGQLSTNITAYRIVNNNLAQMAPFKANGTINTDANIKELSGETTSKGIELDIEGHPIKNLDIIAGYSFNDMRYTKTSGETGSYIEGARLVNTPKNTANASVFYTLSTSKFKGLKLGATANYIGERVGGWNNQVQADKSILVREIPVSSFTTVDLSAGYTYGKVSILAKVSNITNTLAYYVHENYSVNPIAPRQFVTTLSYKF